MPEPLKVIHVGVGGRGRWPLDIVRNDPHFVSAALVDIHPQRLENARQTANLPESACFQDTAEAAEAVEADLVVACAPTVMHAPIAQAAFQAGLHVLVEKGMTLDWDLAKQLVREAEEADRRFCVAQNYRYLSTEQTLKQALYSETYGDPEIVDIAHHRYRPEPRTLNYENAMMWDMSCHHFDNLNFWLGRPQSILAHTYSASWSKYAPHDANVTAVVVYENGAVCAYTLTHNAQNGRYRAEFHTDKGTVRAYDTRGVQFQPVNSAETVQIPPAETIRSEQAVMNEFRAYIAGGAEPGISGANNLLTLALIEGAARSARRGERVEIDELFQ